MAASKFYAVWQPLAGASEDVHTALVFGFLRHAPADAVLTPWLGKILDGDVAADGLDFDAQWPDYRSAFGGQTTQPELTFSITKDGRRRLIVIENKVYEPHTLAQTRREVIDSARARPPMDVTLVMVGVDGRCPYDLAAWADDTRATANQYGITDVDLDLAYSPWSLIAEYIHRSVSTHPEWAAYATDVVEQLTRQGLYGYRGAPMLDDLSPMNPVNAVAAFNRIVATARLFFGALAERPAFAELGLGDGGLPWMERDPTSKLLDARWDVFSTLACFFTRADWPHDCGAFTAFSFGGEYAELCAGAYQCSEPRPIVAFANSDPENVEPPESHLLTAGAVRLPIVTATLRSVWRYETRRWERSDTADGGPDEEIDWTLLALDAAVEAHSHARTG